MQQLFEREILIKRGKNGNLNNIKRLQYVFALKWIVIKR